MTPSYLRANYTLRPAKQTERKMLMDAFRRLSTFTWLERYRYIGFGSIYFSDFFLFHKFLGIKNMISIEKQVEDKKRFLFNRPFKNIKMMFEASNQALPKIKWAKERTILWLDYDDRLKKEMLEDIGTFFARACSGSMIIVSVNANHWSLPPNSGSKRVAQLGEDVGEGRVFPGITEKDLINDEQNNVWNVPRTFRRIILNEIEDALAKRNAGGDQMMFLPLFNFIYRDGAVMMTIGGLLYNKVDSQRIATCKFQELAFIRTDNDPLTDGNPYRIQVPFITFREMRQLDSQLPVRNSRSAVARVVPGTEIQIYQDIYRYFPNFAEVEI